MDLLGVNPLLGKARTHRGFFAGAIGLMVFMAGSALLATADTPPEVLKVTVGTCYCKCSARKGQPACIKMCDSSKYARAKAAKCAKPRLVRPVNNRDAGPRFPHPGRAERASEEAPTNTAKP